MKTQATLRSITTALLITSIRLSVSANTEQALYIDGKVRTDGVSMAGARVIVERDGIMVQMLTEDVGRIRMRLELQRVYVLSFERAGCMTKKLFFDTHVPMEGMDNAPFGFPFKVTLENSEESAVLQYAQPVGFIRYFHAQKDFGYDTNYRMRRDALPEEDLIARNPPRTGEGHASVSMLSQDAPAGVVEPPKPEPLAATTVSVKRAPLDLLAMRPATALPNLVRTVTPKPAPEPLRGPEMRPAPTINVPPAGERTVSTPAPTTRPTVTRVVRISRPEAVVPPDGRAEELQVEKTYVARTVRITKAGHTREYRRVAHRYGAVHYFVNGTSCGEETYTAGIQER